MENDYRYLNSSDLEEDAVILLLVSLDFLIVERVIEDLSVAEELEVGCKFHRCFALGNL